MAVELLKFIFMLRMMEAFDQPIHTKDLRLLRQQFVRVWRAKEDVERRRNLLVLRSTVSKLRRERDPCPPPPTPPEFDSSRFFKWILMEKTNLRQRAWGRPTNQWLRRTLVDLCAAYEAIYGREKQMAAVSLKGPTARFICSFLEQGRIALRLYDRSFPHRIEPSVSSKGRMLAIDRFFSVSDETLKGYLEELLRGRSDAPHAVDTRRIFFEKVLKR